MDVLTNQKSVSDSFLQQKRESQEIVFLAAASDGDDSVRSDIQLIDGGEIPAFFGRLTESSSRCST